ncbi:PAS domain-containing protein [Halosimplex aquaticum]
MASEPTRDPGRGADPSAAETAIDFDDEKLLDGISLPVFTLSASGRVIAWNASMERLTGVDRDAVSAVDDVRDAFGLEGDDATLAERVIEAPERAHEEFDVELDDGDLGIYASRRRVSPGSGDEIHHCEFSARPLYQDGDLTAVMQVVQDRTETVRREEAVDAFVAELSETMSALAEGDSTPGRRTRTRRACSRRTCWRWSTTSTGWQRGWRR